eukprot:gene1855-2429_t
MTRGNQREIDRARAAARDSGKGEGKTGNPQQRQEADAKALQDKIAAKKARESAVAAGEVIPEKKKGD